MRPPPAPPASGLPRIYLAGPIASVGEAARGGFQACNRRTIDALLARSVDVHALPYPHPKARGWRKMAEYTIGFLSLYGQLLRCRPGSLLHITAVGAHFIYNEWPLVWLAQRRGCKVIFDVRAGAAQMLYESGGRLFRRVYRGTLRRADEVMVEGEAFVPFLQGLIGRAPVYLPNHLDVEHLPARAPVERAARPERPTILYIGRIVEEKGIGIVIDACRALVDAGQPVRLQVAGDGEPAYLAALQERAQGLDVQWFGPRRADEVLALFRAADFFLFPTAHVGEGQSNALTEAMACGCVPIASDHGFNAAVIERAGVTLPPGSPGAAYAGAVQDIWCGPGRWSALSAAASQRARSRFATGPVVDQLVAHYRRLAATV